MTAHFDEESWEAEIGAMLGGLPAVGPPDGFIESALDRRPLHAGRTMAGMAVLAVAAVIAVIGTGAVGRTVVTVEPDEVADRHVSVEASVFGTGSSQEYNVVDDGNGVAASAYLPPGFQAVSTVEAYGLVVSVFERRDRKVSVSFQPGAVDWGALEAEGMANVDGRQTWFDPESQITVLQSADGIVTIVGLDLDEVANAPVSSEVDAARSWWQRATDTAGAVAEQLGYPEVGGTAAAS